MTDQTVPTDTKTLLHRLALAVANRKQQDVNRLTDTLIRKAVRSANNFFLDLAAAVASECARGNYERAGFLIADGLFVVETRGPVSMAA